MHASCIPVSSCVWLFLFQKIWIEPSKPVFQVPWFSIASKYSANDMQQQSHTSLPCTTLCHCSECLSDSQTFGAYQKTLLSSHQDIPYAQLRLNFQVQAAFQSNIQWRQNILDYEASSLLHCSLFEDLVRVYILTNYNHE